MKDNIELLSKIIKTAQVGQIRIRCIMHSTVCISFRNTLESQLKEYKSIEREARAIAAARGWELEFLTPIIKAMLNLGIRTYLYFCKEDNRIASLLIKGSALGMIIKDQNRQNLGHSDVTIATLSQKILDCEISKIQKMRGFL